MSPTQTEASFGDGRGPHSGPTTAIGGKLGPAGRLFAGVTSCAVSLWCRAAAFVDPNGAVSTTLHAGAAMRFDLVILGDTPDAWAAAETAARLGRRVAVLRPDANDRGMAIGIAAMLRFFHDEGGARGVEPASPRGLFREALRRHEREVSRARREFGIRSWRGAVRLTGQDSAEAVVDGIRMAFHADRILIATGTTARRRLGLALDRRTLLVPEDASHMQAAPRRLLVLGDNRTARASARLFAAAGSAVTLIDTPVGLAEAGSLSFRTVAGDVLDLRRRGDSVIVHLADGHDLTADAVLFGVNRLGATGTLGLAAAGLEADEDGRLWCDDSGRTWAPTVAAAGEVVGFPRWLRDAAAATVVESLLGEPRAGAA